MKIIILFALVIVSYLLYVAFDLERRRHIGSGLIQDATAFELKSNNTSRTLLIIGDSTGVGVGAKPEESIASLLSKDINATYVENHSVSGAKIEDMQDQLKMAERDRYEMILVQVGGNNIIARNSSKTSAEALKAVLEEAKAKSDEVVHLSAGNVGAAPAVPFFLRPYFHKLTLKYHEAFQKLADELGTTYVNLYVEPKNDPFLKEPKKYLAKDGLHPTAEGYALWFDKIKQSI